MTPCEPGHTDSHEDHPEQFVSSEEILEYAIAREEEAYLFYYDLGNGARSTQLKELFHSFAAEERKHHEKLIQLRDGGTVSISSKMVQNLRIAEYQTAITPEQATDYQKSLMLAMQREKAAFRLYTDLAQAAQDPAVKTLLADLAREEARHKLSIELEYDENVLTDN